MENQSKYLTPDMVEERFHIKKGTLANWRCQGRGPLYLKLGRKVLYRLSDLETWSDYNKVKTIDQMGGEL
jgi:hypothetical protein